MTRRRFTHRLARWLLTRHHGRDLLTGFVGGSVVLWGGYGLWRLGGL